MEGALHPHRLAHGFTGVSGELESSFTGQLFKFGDDFPLTSERGCKHIVKGKGPSPRWLPSRTCLRGVNTDGQGGAQPQTLKWKCWQSQGAGRRVSSLPHAGVPSTSGSARRTQSLGSEFRSPAALCLLHFSPWTPHRPHKAAVVFRGDAHDEFLHIKGSSQSPAADRPVPAAAGDHPAPGPAHRLVFLIRFGGRPQGTFPSHVD